MSNCELKPARVFEQFAKINEIPRPSKHEERMIEYLQEFGKSHGFETETDETGNVVIRSRPQRVTRTRLHSSCRVIWTWFATNS